MNEAFEIARPRVSTLLGDRNLVQATLIIVIAGLCAGLILVMAVPPWAALAALGMMVALGLMLFYPFWALFLLITSFFMPVELGNLTVAQAFGIVTIAVGFISHIFHRRPFRGGPFLVPMICFGGILLLSVVYARQSDPVWHGCRRFFTHLLVYLLILALVDSVKRLRHLFDALLIVGVANGLFGIYKAYTVNSISERAAGLVGNANLLGFLCAFAIPMAFHRFSNGSGWVRRVWYLSLCSILLAGVIVSASRGAMVSLLAGLVVLAYQLRRRLWVLAPIIALLIAIIPLAPEVFYRRVSNLGEDVQHSISLDPTTKLTSRGYLHRAGLKVWRDYPLLGVGTGNFGRYFATSNYNPGWNRGLAIPQHNLYLRVLVENGLIGFTVFSWLLWRLGRQLWFLGVSREHQEQPEVRATSHALVGSTVILLVMGLSMDFLFTHELYILMALSTLTCRYIKGELSSSPSAPQGYYS